MVVGPTKVESARVDVNSVVGTLEKDTVLLIEPGSAVVYSLALELALDDDSIVVNSARVDSTRVDSARVNSVRVDSARVDSTGVDVDSVV